MLAKEEEITGEGVVLLFTPKSGHIMARRPCVKIKKENKASGFKLRFMHCHHVRLVPLSRAVLDLKPTW